MPSFALRPSHYLSDLINAYSKDAKAYIRSQIQYRPSADLPTEIVELYYLTAFVRLLFEEEKVAGKATTKDMEILLYRHIDDICRDARHNIQPPQTGYTLPDDVQLSTIDDRSAVTDYMCVFLAKSYIRLDTQYTDEDLIYTDGRPIPFVLRNISEISYEHYSL